MSKLNMKNFFIIKFVICLIFSFLVYLSFRIDLHYDSSLKITISFILIQIIIWGIFFFQKIKIFSIISYNLFLIVLLNLFFTPIFHSITFDVPVRQPNYKITKEYKGEFFKGMLTGKHVISSDAEGFRTNKKINYKNKEKNTFRIFTVGASTTEEGVTDDNKTWSSLLATKLDVLSNKNVEVINTGMAGLRAEHHYFMLKRINEYKPDLVILLMGINDWNYHIVNSDKKYLIPIYEIKFNFKKSPLFNTFHNINKQIYRKLINKKKENKKNLNFVSAELDAEAYLLSQINSSNIREKVKSFKPQDVSENYKYWSNQIINECKKRDFICLFLDQPTAYKKNISTKLKKRLWMTPPNQNYTLVFDDLIFISSFYNNWLKKKIIDNKLNFLLLSDQIDASTEHLYDDCHFTENGSKKISDVLVQYINLSLKSIFN